jgi:triacylglycerol lipase
MLTLDPTKVAFNWPNARACLEMCAASYQLGPFDSRDPVPIIVQSRTTNAQALVQDRGHCVVVAFRGSCEPEDYVQDGKFELVTLVWTRWEQDAEVHKGFLEDFESLHADLFHAIRNILARKSKPFVPIFVTGHSLGGGLAILCALEFVRQHLNVVGVYTFGQPRVGNHAFAKLYAYRPNVLDHLTFRVVNENDIVPRVPFPPIYRHVGQKIFLRAPNGVLINPHWWETADSDLRGFCHAALKHTDVLVGDHHLPSYQKRIQLL